MASHNMHFYILYKTAYFHKSSVLKLKIFDILQTRLIFTFLIFSIILIYSLSAYILNFVLKLCFNSTDFPIPINLLKNNKKVHVQ